MPWNWELPGWPHFKYDPEFLFQMGRHFLLGIGGSTAYLKTDEGAAEAEIFISLPFSMALFHVCVGKPPTNHSITVSSTKT